MMSSILSPAGVLAAGIKPSRAVAYYRSSLEASYSHQTLSAQYRSILAWANQQNIDIIHEFVDGSHSTPDLSVQPGFERLLEWVQQRSDFTFILCYEPSCLSRNDERWEALLATCIQHGKQLIFTAPSRSTEGASR